MRLTKNDFLAEAWQLWLKNKERTMTDKKFAGIAQGYKSMNSKVSKITKANKELQRWAKTYDSLMNANPVRVSLLFEPVDSDYVEVCCDQKIDVEAIREIMRIFISEKIQGLQKQLDDILGAD